MTPLPQIIALGARTAVGLTAHGCAAAVRAGISRVREHPFLVDSAGDKLKCGYDSVLDPQELGVPRLVSLARQSLAEVVRNLTAKRPLTEELPVLLALPETRPGFSPEQARFVQQKLASEPFPGLQGLNVERCGDGHAGALRALELAVQRVRQGHHELCVVGGVDSYLVAETLEWLDSEQRLARDGIRSGFPPGEGACFLAVASNAARSALGLPSLAKVRSATTLQERASADSEEGLLGAALTQAFLRTGEALDRPHEVFCDVYCDINGERSRTDDFGFALMRTSHLFRDGTDYAMSTSQCGDLGAASAAFNCMLATRAWQRHYAKGPLALIWGASWGGLRGAAVLEQGAS